MMKRKLYWNIFQQETLLQHWFEVPWVEPCGSSSEDTWNITRLVLSTVVDNGQCVLSWLQCLHGFLRCPPTPSEGQGLMCQTFLVGVLALLFRMTQGMWVLGCIHLCSGHRALTEDKCKLSKPNGQDQLGFWRAEEERTCWASSPGAGQLP